MKFTRTMIEAANQVNLVEWLQTEHQTLEKCSDGYRWDKAKNVRITENQWFPIYGEIKGEAQSAITFLMYYFGVTFETAVPMLLRWTTDDYLKAVMECEGIDEAAARVQLEQDLLDNRQQRMQLPKPCAKRSDENVGVCAWLTGEYQVAESVVSDLLSSGSIYETGDAYELVAVSKGEDGIPRYAEVWKREKTDATEQIKQGSQQLQLECREIQGSDITCGFFYLGTGSSLVVFSTMLDMMSYMTLKLDVWKNYCYLVLHQYEEQALWTVLKCHPQIKHIFLCMPNEEDGHEASIRISKEIYGNYQIGVVMTTKENWSDTLRYGASLEDKVYYLRTYKAERKISVIRMSDVQTQEVQWLWKPYIPFGKVTIIQGNPGEGKTTVALRLAAACTNHKLFPEMEDIQPFPVIYQTAEDGLGDTIKPRLLEAGADLSKVMVIDESKQGLSFSDVRIEAAIRQNRAKLLILDPIQAYIGANIDMNRANEVRTQFKQLAEVAEHTGCAVVLIGHLNKGSGGQAAYRGLGSIDFRAAARSVLLIGRLKDDPTTRVLVHDKSSLAPEGKSQMFSLGDENGFEWLGACDITADELLSGRSGGIENKIEQAQQVMLNLLSDGKRISFEELDQAGADQGIADRTMRKARNLLKKDFGEDFHTERDGTKWYARMDT